MNILDYMKKHAANDKRSQRFRDARGFYASSALHCLRDQYWQAIGEPATNPTDMVGKLKMMVGSAVEVGIVKEFFSDMHWYGLHLLGTQIPVGGTNPAWDGYLDALLFERKTKQKYVVELKTKSGYGADLLYESCEPSEDYMAQLGLYLKDLTEKGVTSRGCLMYVLMSDKHFGTLLQLSAQYDLETKVITFFEAQASTGGAKKIHYEFNVQKVLDRWTFLEQCIKEKKTPPPDYHYKTELTKDFIKGLSDGMLRKACMNERVLGDWQPVYSRYFDLQLKTDGIQKGYTEEELAILKAAYRKRHPRAKV